MEIKTSQVWTYILRYARPFPLSIAAMIVVAIVWSVDLSLKPYLLKTILNRLSKVGNQAHVFRDLMSPMTWYVLMCVVRTTIFRTYGYFVDITMIPKMRERIANDGFGHLIDKSHYYYQNNFSGSLANKINDLTTSVPELLQIIIDRFFGHGLALCVAIGTLWLVGPVFAIAMFLWTALFVGASFLLSDRLTKQSEAWSEYGSIITGKIVDALTNILSIRLFAAKKVEKTILHDVFDTAVKAEQKLQWSYFWMWFFYGYTFCVVQILNFYFLCKGKQEGWITVGDFALVLVINVSIIDFLWQIAKDFSLFSRLWGRTTQALRVVLDPPELTDQRQARRLQVSRGEIAFESVTFHYTGADPIFQNLSICIGAGQKVGLVGYSGGGKSTFVNLILRLYDVTHGAILIDGQNIRDVAQDSVREHIAMIPQDPSLFHRSLMENIRYGRIDATDEEVVEAAKKAHAHDFICSLSEGYDSLVGERGVKLSGGQRQRIAIARAILKNAPILILDEATSQLDSVTEGMIQESLLQLFDDTSHREKTDQVQSSKTVLVIAHRLSTLLHMDRILVFHKGHIVEDGTHSDLLSKGGRYQQLWDAQVGGFLGHEPMEGRDA